MIDGMVQLNSRLARHLVTGTILYSVHNRNKAGDYQRWRVTSVKTWKRNPDRVEIGIKHGLYSYDKINQNQLDLICISNRDMQDLRMRADGWTSYRYRHMESVRILENDSALPFQVTSALYTWRYGWTNGTITKIGRVKAYGSHNTHCQACGNLRLSQSDSLNPLPKLCHCGQWF
jgi:hypothetical protein